MHYLITGHTGFKGAWLSLLLLERGHSVSGLSLNPVPGALFETAGIGASLTTDYRVDIRDAAATSAAIHECEPEVVLHLAAQPLVRESYRDPRGTFETNVMGTLNVIEAVSTTRSVKAHVLVTTDKVYRNVNQVEGYIESDALGGVDPYSASKAMADILGQSWVRSFAAPPTAIVRAGNVIGGGDVSRDRLLPDLLSSFSSGEPAVLRYPDAVRPWQHVLDCLNGYLTIAEALLDGAGTGEWNIGPGTESFVSVRHVADLAAALWGNGGSWITDSSEHPHEANLLALDASKAERELGWQGKLLFPTSVEWTIEWQKRVADGQSPREVTAGQIARFDQLA